MWLIKFIIFHAIFNLSSMILNSEYNAINMILYLIIGAIFFKTIIKEIINNCKKI